MSALPLATLATKRTRVRRAAGVRFFEPADPVRVHVRKLMGQGMPITVIAQLAEVGRSTISNLIYGGRHGRLPRRTTAYVSDHILAVRFDLDELGEHTLVNVCGTRRRIQGLVTAGYGLAAQSRMVGWDAQGSRIVRLITKNERIEARIARMFRDLAQRLIDEPPPRRTWGDRISYGKAIKFAERRGWLPLMAWDPDTIDDPAAGPVDAPEDAASIVDPMAVERALAGRLMLSQLSDAERLEVARRIVERGDSPYVLTELVHCSTKTARRLMAQAVEPIAEEALA